MAQEAQDYVFPHHCPYKNVQIWHWFVLGTNYNQLLELILSKELPTRYRSIRPCTKSEVPRELLISCTEKSKPASQPALKAMIFDSNMHPMESSQGTSHSVEVSLTLHQIGSSLGTFDFVQKKQ